MPLKQLLTWPVAAIRYWRCRPEIRSLVIVEGRDEVFARLSADMAFLGLSIARAESVQEARQALASSGVDLVLANREISADESGWLSVSKWASKYNRPRIWLYTAWPASLDEHWRTFTKVERLLYYGGNVWLLSELISAEIVFGFERSRKRCA